MTSTTARAETAREMISKGRTLSEVGKVLGVTTQRVEQLLHPEKRRARAAVAQHIRSGFLYKPLRCEGCDSLSKIQGHHSDYKRPLQVVWLCNRCHAALHAHLRVLNGAKKTIIKRPYKRYSRKLKCDSCTFGLQSIAHKTMCSYFTKNPVVL